METHAMKSCGTRSCAVNVPDHERLLSMAAGSLLAGWGVRHLLSGKGLLSLAVGAGLLRRGLTGNCPLYSSIGMPELQPADARGSAGAAATGATPQTQSDWDRVDEAEQESFPASDSPSWTGTATSRAVNHPR